jgi:hypothetical protein
VFTTEYGPGVRDRAHELPGFQPGDTIIAKAWYAQILYVEEYERV